MRANDGRTERFLMFLEKKALVSEWSGSALHKKRQLCRFDEICLTGCIERCPIFHCRCRQWRYVQQNDISLSLERHSRYTCFVSSFISIIIDNNDIDVITLLSCVSSLGVKLLIVLTLNVRGPGYLGLTRSISRLLMPWLLTSPGHQQPWYWLCRIGRFLSYLKKDLNYLRRINVEK